MEMLQTRRHTFLRVAYRWFSGRPLDGRPRTDCTALRPGTKTLYRTHVRPWGYLPGWQRSLIRNTSALTLIALVYGIVFHPTETKIVAALALVAGLAWGAWTGWQSYQVWDLRRRYVLPLHVMLTELLGLPGNADPDDYITVPRTFATVEETPVRIIMPPAFASTAANKDAIGQAVLPKLGRNLDNTDVIFESVGRTVAVFKMAPQPPDLVLWDDVLEHLEACAVGEIFVGLGARNRPYIRDFREGEVVHGGFNGNTGSGKSVFAMASLAQVIRQDPLARVGFVDPKQSALPNCLVGVPGYELANNPDDVESMWALIERFEAEMDRRRAARLLDPTLEFPFMFLTLDELSEFADLTKERWMDIKEKDDPKTAPIWRSIARLFRMGREFGVRILVFTQRLDAASMGGFGLRDLLGWRGLSKFKRNQWMMLVGTTPVPKAVNKIGRWIYTDGDTERWVQNVLVTPEQIRDWATGRDLSQVPSPRIVPATENVQVEPGTDNADERVTGNTAAAAYLGIDVEAFRKRAQRAEIIPLARSGNKPVYSTEQLDSLKEKV